MMHYLHHIIFDPLSVWEQFEIELTILGIIGIAAVVFVALLAAAGCVGEDD